MEKSPCSLALSGAYPAKANLGYKPLWLGEVERRFHETRDWVRIIQIEISDAPTFAGTAGEHGSKQEIAEFLLINSGALTVSLLR